MYEHLKGRSEGGLAIETLNSHIDSAIQLQKRINSAYMAIGRKEPWNEENNPTDEDRNVNALDSVIGYKRLDKFSLARPLKEGESKKGLKYPTVTYGQLDWVLIPIAEAYKEGARWIYAEVNIVPDDFPLGMYRQVGLHLDLVPNKGVTKPNLEPKDVKDSGILYFYANRPPQNRVDNTYVTEQFMIKV